MVFREENKPLASVEPPYRFLISTLQEANKARNVEGMRAKLDQAMKEAYRVCRSNFSQLFTREEAEDQLVKVVEEGGLVCDKCRTW